MNIDEKIRQMEAQEADPVFQEERRIRREKAAQWMAKERARMRERMAESFGLSPKDMELLRTGLAHETQAMVAMADPGLLIALSGGPGTGKTTAASAWLYRWATDETNWRYRQEFSEHGEFVGVRLFRGVAGMFISSAKLARWPHYEEEKVKQLTSVTRLVIDDLGAEYLDEKGFYLSLLDEVINERYAHRLPTLLTTNLTADAFKGRYGERIADRIRECGRFVALGSKSMRRKDAQ